MGSFKGRGIGGGGGGDGILKCPQVGCSRARRAARPAESLWVNVGSRAWRDQLGREWSPACFLCARGPTVGRAF
eukprot:9481515-Pyramimonas_sp.AAC.1